MCQFIYNSPVCIYFININSCMYYCINMFPFSVTRNYNGSLSDISQCLNCSVGTLPSPDGKLCEPCLYNCTCPAATHESLDGVCVPLNFLSSWPDNYVVQYESGEKIESEFFRKHLRLSIYLCKVCLKTFLWY